MLNERISEEIFSAIEKSPAGASLRETVRWDRFRDASESREYWKEILGDTAIVFSHMQLFSRLTYKFLENEFEHFTDHEKEILFLSSTVHDIGEAKIKGDGVGDIADPFKTSAQEKIEWKIARKAINQLNIDGELKKRLWDSYEKVIIGKDSKLHLAFKALEKYEYFLTAMNVFNNVSERYKQNLPGIVNAKKLVGRVLTADFPKLLENYVPHFPSSIESDIKYVYPLIDEAFSFSTPLNWATEEEALQFESARISWENWKKWSGL